MSRNRHRRRWRDRLPGRHPEVLFHWRGKEVSRLENLADAVFGFSVTLLVVALEVPRDFAALRDVLTGFPAFIVCFAILMSFWNAHYRFFRRYGLADAFTEVTNYAILLLVLFAVYPLKFLFTAWFAGLFGWGTVPNLTADEVRFVFRFYGAGFVLTMGLFALLYWHAWRRRKALELTAAEIWLTRSECCAFAGCIGVALLSIASTYFTTSLSLPGYLYFLFGPVMGFTHAWHGRRAQAAHAEVLAAHARNELPGGGATAAKR